MIRITLRYSFIFILFILVFGSCKRENDSLGESLVYSDISQVIIDTCSVVMYTDLVDSTATSGQGVILAGRYSDPDFGRTCAISYLTFSVPSSFGETTREYAVYDSMTMLLKPNKYYRGDTTQLQSLSVYKVTENIVLENSYFYNYSHFAVDSSQIGHVQYKPRPLTKDTVRIRISDTYGKDYFGMLCRASDTISKADKFKEHFKGLAISGDTKSPMILGFYNDSSFMRIYYHLSTDALTTLYVDIKNSTSLQFNHITQNRPTPLNKLVKNQTVEIPANASSHYHAYMQPINAIYPVLEFPYLNNLGQLSTFGSIYKAVLELYPADSTYDTSTHPLPSTLNLYVTTQGNDYVSFIADLSSTSTSQVGVLTTDYSNRSKTHYSFDITSFLKSEMTLIGNSKHRLRVVFPSTDTKTTLNSLVLNTNTHPTYPIKLKIYYIRYDSK